jgi:hypothetical protein
VRWFLDPLSLTPLYHFCFSANYNVIFLLVEFTYVHVFRTIREQMHMRSRNLGVFRDVVCATQPRHLVCWCPWLGHC